MTAGIRPTHGRHASSLTSLYLPFSDAYFTKQMAPHQLKRQGQAAACQQNGVLHNLQIRSRSTFQPGSLSEELTSGSCIQPSHPVPVDTLVHLHPVTYRKHQWQHDIDEAMPIVHIAAFKNTECGGNIHHHRFERHIKNIGLP